MAAPSIHILLVDDEPDFRETLRMELERTGMKVLTATDDADAAEMAGLCRFDVVVTGLRAPGIDGHRLLEGLRRASPTTSVVVTAERPAIRDAVVCMRQGAFDYVVKPADVSELRCVVERAVDESRLRRVKLRRALLRAAHPDRRVSGDRT